MKLYTLEETATKLQINMNTLKSKIFTSKSLRSVKIGNSRYVSEYDLNKYIEKLAWKNSHPKTPKVPAVQVEQEYQETGRRMAAIARTKKKV
jgi:ribosomal protein L15E